MQVVIIVPVLGRPHRVAPLIEAFAAATPEPHRVLFVADDDDTAELEALRAADADFIALPSTAPRNYAAKINAGARASREPWLFMAADDLKPRRDWFSRALEWADRKTAVIGTNDLCNRRTMVGDHSTHTLVRRSYITRRGGVIDEPPGVVLHEGYPHEFCDDEFIQTAMKRRVYVHAFDSIVEHLHPNVGKAPDDDTYRRARARTRQGRLIFQRRRRLWRSSPNQVRVAGRTQGR